MLAILPFHSGDQIQALQLAGWIAELGTVQDHQCLIVHDRVADPVIGEEIETILKGAFRNVARMPLRESAAGVKGLNLLFRRTIRQVQSAQAGAFLWMNPDSIPLRRGWLDAIEAAWNMMPKQYQFLGCHLDGPTPHMSAIGVYGPRAEFEAPLMVLAENNPFNLNAASQIVPKMAVTPLIVDTHLAWDDAECSEAARLAVSAVLWHGSADCKNGEMIAFLRGLLAQDNPLIHPLPITARPTENREQGRPGTFAVPADPLTKDNSARRAASLAGSNAVEDEIEVPSEPIVPRGTPRTVINPVQAGVSGLGSPLPSMPVTNHGPKVHPAIAAGIAEQGNDSQKLHEDIARAQKVNDAAPLYITAANVGEFTAALAGFRDKDAASKALVLASLRTHGFSITGKQQQRRGAVK